MTWKDRYGNDGRNAHLVLALRAIEAEGLPALLATIWDLVISGRTMAEAGISYVSPLATFTPIEAEARFFG